MTSAADATRQPRRRYIDWARGTAVLIMIEAHTLDAWTRVASRHGVAFNQLSMLGGFAAPLFLWLAGLSLALSAERSLERGATRRAAMHGVIRRGAEIFILAFLFRLQAFVISPGSWMVTIFRVDILNVMGIAIGCAGLLWGLAGGARRSIVLSVAAVVAIVMTTPLIREAGWVNALPLWLQWHLRPFGDHTTFTLFPWAGFVFAGVSVGTLLAHARSRKAERQLLVSLGAAGAALTWFGFYTASLPTIYHSSFFWTSSPTFFAIRAGIMLVALALLFAAAELGPAIGNRTIPGIKALETFGRNSLFIYWIHVELVYGYVTWPLKHRLPLWGTAIAWAVFTLLMYLAIGWRDRLAEQWRQRGLRNSTAGAVPA